METLKEKTKKHERRFGMSKKRMVGLALGTVGLMGLVYSYVQAGSFTDSPTSETYKPKGVAKELVDVAAVNATMSFDNSTNTYKPSQIPLGSLTGPTISVSVDKGRIYVNGTDVAICNSNVTIAQYQSGSGTDNLVFSSSTTTVSNGASYSIRNNNCTGPANLTFEIPKGASSVTLTIKTGVGATQTVLDTASAQIISVVPQFSASVTKKLNNEIDYTYDFKKFENSTSGNDTSDNGTIILNSKLLDKRVHEETSSDNATFSVTLKPTDMAGIANATITNGTCFKGVDSFTCNATYDISSGPGNNTFTITVNVTGTDVLSERKFTVDALLDFAASNATDRTFFTNEDFGAWNYKGTTIYIPLIGHDPAKGRNTFIKLQSKDKNPSANKVKAIILANNGDTVTADLGRISAGQPFVITGQQLVDKVQAAGKAVGDSFAAILVVTTAEENLFGYAVLTDSNGVKRVPLKVRNGNISE